MSNESKRKYLIAGILVLLMGIATIGWVVWQYSSAWASRHWPTTTGVIKMSKIHVTPGQRNKWGAETKAWIVYEYTVDGQDYLGERIGYGIVTNPHINTQELVSR